MKSQRAELKAMQKVGVAKEFYEAKQKDAQRAGELVLDAKFRLGELTQVIPKKINQHECLNTTVQAKRDKIHELGLNHGEVSRYEKLAEKDDDAKREDLNRANELLIEAKVRLGEFSKKLDREQGNHTSGTGAQSELRRIGIDPRNARRYEKMTAKAAEIEIQNARDEGRPPEQRKVIQIAEAIKEKRLDNYLNSFTAYDESDKGRAELRGKLDEIEKRKKMSDAVDKPIRAVWAMPVTPEYIDCFIEYAYCTDSKNLKQHFQIIDESIEKLYKFKDVLKEKLIEKGNILEVIN